MPRVRLLFAAALAAFTALPLPARAEDPFTRTGVFRALVEDDFAAAKSLTLYELETDAGEVLPLRFRSPPDTRSGERVSVTGWAGRHAFEVDEIHPIGRSPLGREPLSTWTTGAKRVLVILMNFTDDTSLNATTVTNAQNVFFGASGSVAAYYNEASFGLATMTGDVALVTATIAKPTTCDSGAIETQAQARANAAGYAVAGYDFLVYVFPSLGSCGWAGLGYVGWRGAWINGPGYMYLLVAAHELGHNFGVLHAHSYTCPSAAIAPSGCSRSEYGDPLDVMGNGRAGHFNAYSKDYFGWLPAGSVRKHAGGTATYTLGALEAGGQVTYAVKVPTSRSDRTYWIEWRNRSGFDAVEPSAIANGGLVHFAPSSVSGTDLLDMTPATAGNFDDSELDVGKSFTDPELSLSITALSKTASSLTVQVQYGLAVSPASYNALTPCRAIDTRNAAGPYGGPALSTSGRTFLLRGVCGIPSTATGVTGNLTVTQATAAGRVRMTPNGSGATGTSTISFTANSSRANNVVSGLGATGDVLLDGLASGTAHVIFDVTGWFQ